MATAPADPFAGLDAPVADEWFERERGIHPTTLDRFTVLREGGEAKFQYDGGWKIRAGFSPGEQRRFFNAPGGSPHGLFMPHVAEPLTGTVFLVEGESDTMRLQQELWDEGRPATVVGLPGINHWRPELADLFEQTDNVFVILDNDQDYNVVAKTNQVWVDIRKDIGPRAKRVKLDTARVKDLCEFFSRGLGLEQLGKLVQTPASRFKPLDLSKTYEPRPVEWIVQGMLSKGDIAMLMGEPGVGKSWLSLSLALAIAGGDETWLGLPLLKSGRVLYVDEENPEDVVYDRLMKLGLEDRHIPNLRILHEQGVRLDSEPDALYDEVAEYQPVMTFLDSLTRFHSMQEGSAGEMSALFNDSIKPLSRQLGSSILFLHHVIKSSTSETSSFVRARGTGDMTAFPDTTIDVRPMSLDGHMRIQQGKTRRARPLPPMTVHMRDEDDGRLALVSNVELPPPF